MKPLTRREGRWSDHRDRARERALARAERDLEREFEDHLRNEEAAEIRGD